MRLRTGIQDPISLSYFFGKKTPLLELLLATSPVLRYLSIVYKLYISSIAICFLGIISKFLHHSYSVLWCGDIRGHKYYC